MRESQLERFSGRRTHAIRLDGHGMFTPCQEIDILALEAPVCVILCGYFPASREIAK